MCYNVGTPQTRVILRFRLLFYVVFDDCAENNIRSGVYHAGLSLSKRNEAHEKFLRDELDVVVATIAFGMGIDKPSTCISYA